jgi:hypothetical protein
MAAPTPLLSRRRLLQGAAATAAGTGFVVIAGCAADPNDGSGIIAARVPRVPIDPADSLWADARTTVVELGPQDLALPQQLEPAVTRIAVAALHDGEWIGFMLAWDDPDTNDLSVQVDDFRDACAVLVGPGSGGESLRTMGSPTTAATILHWKADWQRDVDSGRQGLAAAYPNRSVDVYPPLWDHRPGGVEIGDYAAAGATEWLAATHVGNSLSLAERTSPVEKLVAHGFGTTATEATQDALGRGMRTDAGWRVVLAKRLRATDPQEIDLPAEPATAFTCAFAVWSANVGSRKSPSTTVHTLRLGS